MVISAVAFCPGHISGYFRRVEGDSVETTGSTGEGIVISEGVRATVMKADEPSVEIRRTNAHNHEIARISGSKPLESVMARLGVCAAVTTECRLPLEAGFGLSAAALLAGITALDVLHGLSLGSREIIRLAHETEIGHRSGLGDVAACQGGGLECRPVAGIHADITRSLDVPGVIATVTLGTLETSSVIGSPGAMAQVADAYPGRCPTDIFDFFRLSRQFAEHSGLIAPGVRDILDACDSTGVPASMTMLGNGVFAYGDTAAAVLSPYGNVAVMTVARSGVRMVEVTS